MNNAVLVSAVRTPVCKMGGAFRTLDRVDLTRVVIKEAVKRANMVGREAEFEENIWGDIPQYFTPARYVWLDAGLPCTVGGLTQNRGCGTGLSGLITASSFINNGFGDIYMVGGVEMDSKRYFWLQNDNPYGGGLPKITTRLSSPEKEFGNPSMIITAENVAEKYGITREECDEYACRSQKLAKLGYEEGLYPEHIIPVTVPQKKGDPIVVSVDEPLRDTTMEGLAKLRPVVGGVCTAGNSSPVNDGAAAGVIMNEDKACAEGLKPTLRFVDAASAGVDPRYMGIGPVEAVKKLLKRHKMEITDFDFIECNEAFAAQTIAVQRLLDIPLEKLNVRGGGIALGHPYSATGISLAAKSAGIFKRQGGERCLITFCVGGGQGVAAIFDNCAE